MKSEIVLKKNKRRTLGFSVSLFLLAVYLLPTEAASILLTKFLSSL